MSDTENLKNHTSEVLQLVSFKVGTEEFAVDINYVQEINKMLKITPVPNTPAYIEGVVNLRGRVIPVINLRIKLNLPSKEPDKNTRIVVIELKEKTVGFIVDAVNEVLRIPKNITEAPPKSISSAATDFIDAVGKLEDRLLILINLGTLLDAEVVTQLNKVA